MPVPEAAVREQVDRIARSRSFAHAQRLKTLLQFVVDQTLAGHAAELKEAVIGFEVCGRRADFDPKVDPIVRVDASRLRSRLRAYYEGEGFADPVRISLPKGSYVPAFEWAGQARKQPPAATRQPTLAVLPFVNIGASAEEDYIGESLTEEIIHRLSRLRGVRVIARGSVFQYRGRTADLRSIGQQLGADYILEGSVRAVEQRLRVTVQMCEAATAWLLWSERYERQWDSILAIEDEIAAAVTDALRLKLDERSHAIFLHATEDPDAYAHYLRGRHLWNQRSPDALTASLRCYQHALERDPECASALAGIADTLTVMALNDQIPTLDAMSQARAAAHRAVELRPNWPEALESRGAVKAIFDWDWQGGERDLERAIAAHPGSAVAHYLYAVLILQPMGRWREALDQMDIALHLDPVSPVLLRDLGMIHFMRRDCTEAEGAFRQLEETAPGYQGALYWRARLCIAQGRYSEAIEALELRKAAGRANTRVTATAAYALARSGDHGQASRMLADLLAAHRAGGIPALDLATAYLGLENWEEALGWLEEACRQRAATLYQFAVDPIYDPIRTDARGEALRLCLGLPELVTTA